jgi:hypothetical protein
MKKNLNVFKSATNTLKPFPLPNLGKTLVEVLCTNIKLYDYFSV